MGREKRVIDLERVRAYFRKTILPSVSVDGGDLWPEAVEGSTVTLAARGECATCPACGPDYEWWIAKKLTAHFGIQVRVRLIKRPPYYAE